MTDETPRPTIGRIVHYTHDVGEEQNATLAAVVTGTTDHQAGMFAELDGPLHAHLTVLEPGRTPFSKTNVPFGHEAGEWRWPERV
jgi:hypothetical protein